MKTTYTINLLVILLKEVLLQVIWFVVAEPESYVYQPRSSWVSVVGDYVNPFLRAKRSPQVTGVALIHPRLSKLWL